MGITTSISVGTGGVFVAKPQNEDPYGGHSPSDPIFESEWFPDSSGVKTFTANRVDTAIAHRDQVLNDLYARLDALNTELTSINTLGQAGFQLGEIDPNHIPSAFVSPAQPVRPDITTEYPVEPADAVLGTVTDFTIDAVPVLTTAAPTVRTVTPPTQFTKAAPAAPFLPDRSYPTKPNYALPVAKTPISLVLPADPELITVTFDGVLPTAIAQPPNVSFQFTESEYQSMLSGELKTKLLDLVLNVRQSGLNPAIESQIWSRARERTGAEAKRRRASTKRLFASMGWNVPPGDEMLLLKEAEEAAIGDDIGESRNIAIAQANLEQSNFQFAFTQAIALEAQLMNLYNAMQQRAFEAARYAVEAAISLYNLQVAYFNANVTLYTAQAQVYRDRIQGELAKLEIFKAKLDGQRLLNEINAQDLQYYRAQIDAVVAIFGLYQSELNAVKTQIEGDGLKIQQFEASIRGYAEEIKAASLDYDRYKSEWTGEEIKASMYKTIVEAFGKEIEAFSSVTDAKVKKLDADIKVNFDVPLKVLEQRNEIYKTKVLAKTSQIEGLTRIYQSDADVFGKLTDAEGTRVKTGIDLLNWELAKITKKVDTDIEVFKANIATLLAQKEIIISARKTEAQLKAQIAASIGGSVNFSSSISGSSSYDNAIPTTITI